MKMLSPSVFTLWTALLVIMKNVFFLLLWPNESRSISQNVEKGTIAWLNLSIYSFKIFWVRTEKKNQQLTIT